MMLKNNGLTGSMGRVGAAGDNARMESFHSLLQNNVLDTKKWETREELRVAIVTWIERTYHRRRRKRSLGRMRIPAFSDRQSGVFGHSWVRSEVAERPTFV